MGWARIRAGDKLAFREDLQADPTLTDLQKRMISVIAQNWDNDRMSAECSLSFIAVGVGSTKKMAHKYVPTLVDSGRVSIKRGATHTASTLWDVNWWYRGSAWTRAKNGGQPIQDCRRESPNAAHGAHVQGSPSDAQGSPPTLQGGVPQVGDEFHSKECIGVPEGALSLGTAQGKPKKERKDNPNRALTGFARWRVVHAEYQGADEDMFVAHLRSGSSRKFVLRCHVDSDDYESLDGAMSIDGEAGTLVGKLVQMSTNKSGPKTFARGEPMPWETVVIVSGEDTDEGAEIRVRYADDTEATLQLSAGDAARLFDACGGQERTVGARVRYRLLPDDTIAFELAGAAA